MNRDPIRLSEKSLYHRVRNGTRTILALSGILLGILLLFYAFKHQAEVPAPYQLESAPSVSYRYETFARAEGVHSVDASEEYIFLSHGHDNVISAFDWGGSYCFTIVTEQYRRRNGFLELICCGNELTIIDQHSHVYVYDGPRLIREEQLGSLEEYSRFQSELTARRNHLVTLRGTQVVDEDGNPVLTVSDGRLIPHETLLLSAVGIVLFVNVVNELVGRKRWKKDPDRE